MKHSLPWLFLTFPILAFADEAPLSLSEQFAPGSEYRVTTRVDLKGELEIPVEEGKPAKKVKMEGKSAIEYDERVLPTQDKTGEQKAFRIYKTIDFSRSVGDQKQEMTLRPEVRRLVTIRKNQTKVPFSPDGALTWGEIDLLRTDIFLPALTGLLPANAVKPGDRWKVSDSAALELTDMEKISEGELTCKFEETITLSGRRSAHITLTGDLKGINEDGPVRQRLSGRLYFDLTSNHIAYLSINGEHLLLDKDGTTTGKIEGGFVMVRKLAPRHPELTDAAIERTAVEPDADNTRLLYQNEQLGVSFTYPRSWHVVRVQNNRITLDEKNGNGILITLEPAKRVPKSEEFLRETQAYLKELQAKVSRTSPTARIGENPNELDRFTIDAEIGGQRVAMDYLIARQPKGGAIFAARLLDSEKEIRLKEVEKIARSFQITKTVEEK